MVGSVGDGAFRMSGLELATATALGLPDFLCSSSTIELGSILSGRDFAPDGIIQSTAGACDANRVAVTFAQVAPLE